MSRRLAVRILAGPDRRTTPGSISAFITSRWGRRAAVLAALLTFGPASGPTMGHNCPLERANVSNAGDQANAFSNWDPSISADGTYVAFASDADNLVPGDTNATRDIFVHNRMTEVTIRVSEAVDPPTGDRTEGDDYSSLPYITPDGQYVAFYSRALNLAPGVTVPGQIYVHDRDADGDGLFDEPGPGETSTVLVSVDAAGVEADVGVMGEPHGRPVMSPDGMFVAFTSSATNLDPGFDANGMGDVFVHDRDADADGIPDEPGAIMTVVVSVDAITGMTIMGNSFGPAIVDPTLPGFGFLVAYTTDAPLDPADTNLTYDIYVTDLAFFFMPFRVSTDPFGGDSDATSNMPPWITPGGQYVVYSSLAGNLVDGDSNLDFDVFVYDFATLTNTMVSVTDSGEQAAGTSSTGQLASISDDGRYVAIASTADNLVPGYSNGGMTDIFRHDRDTDADGIFDEPGAVANILLSKGFNGDPSNGPSGFNSISADGMFVAFACDAENLVPGDNNGMRDMFVADPLAPQYAILQQPMEQTACEGTVVSFNVGVTSGVVVAYQWFRGGTDIADGGNISGANTPILLIDTVTLADEFPDYRCVITGHCGPMESEAVALNVLALVNITQHPVSQETCEGGSVFFTANATGEPPLSYQWRKDGQDIPGANGQTYAFDDALPEDSGTYDVRVTNVCGPAISLSATLSVWPVGGGDTNGDGLVDGNDTQGFIDALLDPQTPSRAVCAADMNGDTTVDLLDLPLFITVLLGP